MRRAIVFLVGALALVSLGGASAATTIDWKSLPYYDALTARLRLSTDASWRGAHAVSTGPFKLQADPSWPKLKREWIWAPTCEAAAQRVVFSKTIFVPGAPYDGSISLYYGPGNQYYGGRPYTSGSLQVNGVEI